MTFCPTLPYTSAQSAAVNPILSADDLPGETETIRIDLVIPPAIACASPRAGRVGGRARVHPSWSPTSTDAPSLTEYPCFGPGLVSSVAPTAGVTFHRRMGSFQALSVKTGRVMSGLGPHEQAQSEELEVNPDIVDFCLQGLRLIWPEESSYRPDYHAHHVTTGLIAGEVKADASYFLDPDYAPTMANARRTLEGVGISFEKVEGTTLHGNVVRRRNVRRAYCDRFTAVSEGKREAVRELLATKGEVALGEIHRILANDARTAQLLVHALLVRRVLSYDLDLPVTRDTIVAAPREPAASIDIRGLELSEAA